MEMTRNNEFSSLDCWGLWKELVVLSYSVLAVISAGFSLPDVQSDVLFPSCMHTTVFSIYQQLRQFVICLLMSLMHCIRSLVSRMCVFYNVHTFLHQSPNSVVDRVSG